MPCRRRRCAVKRIARNASQTWDWCQTFGNQKYCANLMDRLRYQSSSGVAKPPGRRANDVRQSLEPDGCLARSVAAMNRRIGCARYCIQSVRPESAAHAAEGIVCSLDTGSANGCHRFQSRRRTSQIGRDGMDTALSSGMYALDERQRPSRTDRHQCARVEFQDVHLRNGGPK